MRFAAILNGVNEISVYANFMNLLGDVQNIYRNSMGNRIEG